MLEYIGLDSLAIRMVTRGGKVILRGQGTKEEETKGGTEFYGDQVRAGE